MIFFTRIQAKVMHFFPYFQPGTFIRGGYVYSFYSILPGGTFIWEGTFIWQSRVHNFDKISDRFSKYFKCDVTKIGFPTIKFFYVLLCRYFLL